MERTFDKNRYRGIIDIANLFLKWLILLLYVVIGFMAVGLVVMLFIPKGLLNFDLALLKDINIQVFNMAIDIDESIFEGIINVKNMILVLLLTGVVNLGFTQFILINLRNLILSIKQDIPFREKNSDILKYMGYGFLGASIILPLFRRMMMITIFNAFDIFQSTSLGFSLNLQYVFMGALILILAYVFSYGSFLQEEHDTTI